MVRRFFEACCQKNACTRDLKISLAVLYNKPIQFLDI